MIDPIGPQKIKGGLAPLFVRLTDLEPDIHQEVSPYGFLSPEALKLSIFDEIDLLLNTRCAPQKGQPTYGVSPHFGIENFSIYDGVSPSSWPTITASLEKTIRAFEPRLGNPEVVITSYDTFHQTLNLSISGMVSIGEQKERISFQMHLGAT